MRSEVAGEEGEACLRIGFVVGSRVLILLLY